MSLHQGEAYKRQSTFNAMEEQLERLPASTQPYKCSPTLKKGLAIASTIILLISLALGIGLGIYYRPQATVIGVTTVTSNDNFTVKNSEVVVQIGQSKTQLQVLSTTMKVKRKVPKRNLQQQVDPADNSTLSYIDENITVMTVSYSDPKKGVYVEYTSLDGNGEPSDPIVRISVPQLLNYVSTSDDPELHPESKRLLQMISKQELGPEFQKQLIESIMEEIGASLGVDPSLPAEEGLKSSVVDVVSAIYNQETKQYEIVHLEAPKARLLTKQEAIEHERRLLFFKKIKNAFKKIFKPLTKVVGQVVKAVAKVVKVATPIISKVVGAVLPIPGLKGAIEVVGNTVAATGYAIGNTMTNCASARNIISCYGKEGGKAILDVAKDTGKTLVNTALKEGYSYVLGGVPFVGQVITIAKVVVPSKYSGYSKYLSPPQI